MKKAHAMTRGRTPRPLNYQLLKEVLDIVEDFNRVVKEVVDLERKLE
jgi:hypothetical protein